MGNLNQARVRDITRRVISSLEYMGLKSQNL